MKTLSAETVKASRQLHDKLGLRLSDSVAMLENPAIALSLHGDEIDKNVEHLHGFFKKASGCLGQALTALEKMAAGKEINWDEREGLQHALEYIQYMRDRVEEYQNPEERITIIDISQREFGIDPTFKPDADKRETVLRARANMPNPMQWREIDENLEKLEALFNDSRIQLEKIMDAVDADCFLEAPTPLSEALKNSRWMAVRPYPYSSVIASEVCILNTKEAQEREAAGKMLTAKGVKILGPEMMQDMPRNEAYALSKYLMVKREDLLRLGIQPLSYQESDRILQTHPLKNPLQPLGLDYGIH